jgi:hypothetical protein
MPIELIRDVPEEEWRRKRKINIVGGKKKEMKKKT